MDRDASYLLGALCGIVFVIALVILIGAVILRAACSLFNSMSGASSKPRRRNYDDDPDDEPRSRRYRRDDDDLLEPRYSPRGSPGVPEPSFGKACGIMAIALVIHVIVQFGLGFVIVMLILADARGGGPFIGASPMASILIGLISLPIDLLVLAGLSSAMLPTSFGKGLLVALLDLLIWFVVGVVIIGVLFVVGMMLGGMGGMFR
jgi:hypothetical protein